MIDERKRHEGATGSKAYTAQPKGSLQPARASGPAKTYPSKASLVFFGNERLATAVTTTAPTLRALIQAGYDIKAVVSSYSQGRSRSARKLEIAAVAKKHNIPLLLPEKVSQITDDIKKFDAGAAVLVAFGQIVPTAVIDLFPIGIINIHPSLLPKYRGPTPLEQAILDGAARTGVSLMKLAPKMDAGPVFAQQELNLSSKETKQELADKLLRLGSEVLIKNLPAILDGSLRPKGQNESEATYSKLLAKEDGSVNWYLPAENIERQVRAYAGFPKSSAKIFGHDVIITKARVASGQNDGDLVMKCQPGWLEIQELTAPSGRSMSGADFIRGYARTENREQRTENI